MQGLGPNENLIGQPGSRGRLMTPALLVDLDALERNIARMAAFARDKGVALRPHAKTHKSVQIARMQVEAGALGICCATLGEAEALAKGGIAGLLITSPVVTAAKAERLVRLNETAEDLMIVCDDEAMVDLLSQAAAGSKKPLKVAVELDVGSHRTGAFTPEAAFGVARRIAGSNSLTFAGIHAYAGNLQHLPDYAERKRRAAAVAETLGGLRRRLEAAGLHPGIVSGAGTGTHEIDGLAGHYSELQVGSYIFTDDDYFPVRLREGEAHPFEPALFVACTVIGVNHAGVGVTDGGIKRFAMDRGKPQVLRGAPAGATHSSRSDEHGQLNHPEGSPPPVRGSVIECLTPHCDPTVNLYDHYHVVRGDTLVDIWPVDARGAF